MKIKHKEDRFAPPDRQTYKVKVIGTVISVQGITRVLPHLLFSLKYLNLEDPAGLITRIIFYSGIFTNPITHEFYFETEGD